jgi:hypothetical protein
MTVTLAAINAYRGAGACSPARANINHVVKRIYYII